jgi:hypothetical protein
MSPEDTPENVDYSVEGLREVGVLLFVHLATCAVQICADYSACWSVTVRRKFSGLRNPRVRITPRLSKTARSKFPCADYSSARTPDLAKSHGPSDHAVTRATRQAAATPASACNLYLLCWGAKTS